MRSSWAAALGSGRFSALVLVTRWTTGYRSRGRPDSLACELTVPAIGIEYRDLLPNFPVHLARFTW